MTKTKNPLLPVTVLMVFAIALFALTIMAFRDVPAPAQIPTKSTSETSGKMIPFNFGAQRITLDKTVLTFSNGSFAVDSDKATIGQRTVNSKGNKAAAIMTDQPGGSGTFYYLLGGSLGPNGEVYSKPVLLGDRIKFETLTVSDDGEIVVTYKTRAANAPMSSEPTKEMSVKYAFQDDGNLISVLH